MWDQKLGWSWVMWQDDDPNTADLHQDGWRRKTPSCCDLHVWLQINLSKGIKIRHNDDHFPISLLTSDRLPWTRNACWREMTWNEAGSLRVYEFTSLDFDLLIPTTQLHIWKSVWCLQDVSQLFTSLTLITVETLPFTEHF